MAVLCRSKVRLADCEVNFTIVKTNIVGVSPVSCTLPRLICNEYILLDQKGRKCWACFKGMLRDHRALLTSHRMEIAYGGVRASERLTRVVFWVFDDP